MSRAKECRGSGRLSSNVAPPFSGFDITDISSSVLVSTITGGLVLIIIEGDYQEHLRLCWFLEIGRICPCPHTVFAHPSAVTVRPLRRWRCTLSCTQLAATSREVLGLISITVFRRLSLIDIRRRVGSNWYRYKIMLRAQLTCHVQIFVATILVQIGGKWNFHGLNMLKGIYEWPLTYSCTLIKLPVTNLHILRTTAQLWWRVQTCDWIIIHIAT